MTFDQINICILYNEAESEGKRVMSKTGLKEFVERYIRYNFQDMVEGMEEAFKDPIGIAYYIAVAAHDEQKRENGNPYIVHPTNMYHMYRNLININGKEFDAFELEDYGIPYYGVQELCLLHDVVEDWCASVEDIRGMYDELGFGLYFDNYIRVPLKLITHYKNVDYDSYMEMVLKSDTASLVKLLDLTDNLNIFGLKKYEELEDKRMKRYLKYRKWINDQYRFVEKIAKYRKERVIPYLYPSN